MDGVTQRRDGGAINTGKTDESMSEEKNRMFFRKNMDGTIEQLPSDETTSPMVVGYGATPDSLPPRAIDYKAKYETLKEFVRGKWKGDCSECAAIANTILNEQPK